MRFGQTRNRRQSFPVAAVALLLAMIVSACAGGADGSDRSTRELKLLIPVQANALDPTKGSIGSLGVLLLGLEPLALYNSDGEIVPNLAESVSQPDPKTYRYTLRSGVKFWDGTPLTAEDVVFSFELHHEKGSESFNAGLWASVETIEATSDREVTVKLTSADPQFPYVVAQTGIVSKAFYSEHAGDVGTPETLNMGTGPYQFEDFAPSSETILTANKEYWGGRPPFDKLTLRTVDDDSARLFAVQSGEFDGIVGVPLSQLNAFERVNGQTVYDAADSSVYKFNFDLEKSPWDDVHLRKAFAMAVDRAEIVDGVLGGRAVLAPTTVPPEIMDTLLPTGEVNDAYESMEQALPGFDIDAAREELRLSKAPHGLTVNMPITGSDPNLSAIGQVAAQNLAEIGIKLKLQQVDDDTYYNAVYFKHTTEGVNLENFGAAGPDPSNVPLYSLLSANGLPQGSGVNVSNYSNPDVDALLHQSQTLQTADPARGRLLVESMQLAQDDLPYVPLAYPKIYTSLSDRFTYPQFNPFWWMNRWTDDLASAAGEPQ